MEIKKKSLTRQAGVKLKNLREQLNYSKKEMAAYLGISLSAYYKNEYGDFLPGLNSLHRLSTDHDISMDWFIFDKGPRLFKEKDKIEEQRGKIEDLEKMSELEREKAHELGQEKASLEERTQELEKELEIERQKVHDLEQEKARLEEEKRELEKGLELEGEKVHNLEQEKERLQQIKEKTAGFELKPGMEELIEHMVRIPLLYHEVFVHFENFKLEKKELVESSVGQFEGDVKE